ncbi:monocarboxylate transporter 2 [Fusarium agapanthi]|uniref:Monocarboxylate transporter 2 n=1 Tax=Fusarium agapanthi TaxID=1803897 RepID=A0A9P5BHQ7_9HYPO|nr:monocarboxylate transporter 2 [Fusarium agapanthi]
MGNTETVTVSSQIEPHELHTWPAPVSQTAVSQPAARTSIRSSEVDHEAVAEHEHEVSQLAPVDGGIAAWRLLGAAFVFETLLWGFPLSFGVFQDYYSRIPAFSSSPYIGVVGTIASGLGYIGAPFIMPFIQKHQWWRRQMIWVGWPICIGGLVAGSFANTLGALILTQGVAYGIGFLILYYPILMMVNEYWIARRGMAYGILCGASGVSGAVMPFVVQALLSTYGYQTTLRAVAVGLAVLTGPLIPFLDGRLPPSAHVNTPKTNWSFFKSPLFWLYSISNLFQGFGYFFPSLYLPSFATSLDLGARSGPILLAVMSVSQVAGQFVFGYLSDRKLPLDILACSSTLVASMATLTMWRLADSLPVLIGFTILYGFFGAGFTAIWARMSTTITDDVTAGPIVFGLLNFGKGVGNVLAGPIGGLLIYNSSALQHLSASESLSPSSYHRVIIFTGCSTPPTNTQNNRHQTEEMESSNNTRCTESCRSLGRVDNGLDEILRLDDAWKTAWEEAVGDNDGMVLVDAKHYAAFLKWQAGNLEGESTKSPLEPKGSNVQSSQHDLEDRPLSACGDSSSDDEAQAWCGDFEKKMNKMGIRRQFRDILKLLEMSQLMDNDMRLLELVKKKDEGERQKSSSNHRN